MKDALGHGSNAHSSGVENIAPPLGTKYAIATQSKTAKSGWARVPDTKFDTRETAQAYGRKYHTDSSGSEMFKVVEHPDGNEKIAPSLGGRTGWQRDGMGGYVHRNGWKIEPSENYKGVWIVRNPVSGGVADHHKSLAYMKRTYG